MQSGDRLGLKNREIVKLVGLILVGVIAAGKFIMVMMSGGNRDE